MNKRDKRARAVLELMPVTPGCPQATIALLMSQASTHRSDADIKVQLRRCGAQAVKLAEAGLKQPTSATSKVVPAVTIKALDAHRAAEAQNAGEKRAWMRVEDVALLELHAGDLPVSTHHPALVNQTHSARRNRMLLLQKHVGGLVRATFSKSITNQAGPLLELHYERWTRLAPDLALPENAQVDWLNGVARAPAACNLQLDPDSIVLFGAAREEWIDLDASEKLSTSRTTKNAGSSSPTCATSIPETKTCATTGRSDGAMQSTSTTPGLVLSSTSRCSTTSPLKLTITGSTRIFQMRPPSGQSSRNTQPRSRSP